MSIYMETEANLVSLERIADEDNPTEENAAQKLYPLYLWTNIEQNMLNCFNLLFIKYPAPLCRIIENHF